MVLWSLLFFFLVSLGLGFLATFWVKNASSWAERWVMRLGVGMASFIVLGVLLNLLRVPLQWWIFVVITLVGVGAVVYWKRAMYSELWKQRQFRFGVEEKYLLVALILFSFSLFMYASGAFSYPYLENDDPWHHALSVRYVAEEKTLFAPEGYAFKYLDPYPPAFALMMGVLAQTNDSLSWTLKFFNALILALAGLFFYLAAKEFTRDGKAALFAMFVLISLPSFFTHFIWAHTLVVMLFFPALYCVEMLKHDKKWMYVGMIVIGALIMTQPSTGLTLMILLGLYWVVKSLYLRSVQRDILWTILGGVGVSLLWWYDKAWNQLMRQSGKVLASSKYAEIAQEASVSVWGKLKSFFPYNQGTATRAYTFDDFVYAKPFGMINVHVGWGVVVSGLLLLGLLYVVWKYKDHFGQNKEQYWVGVAVVWFVFTFLGTNSMTFELPFGLFAFRFWLVMAIPVALLSWLGVRFLVEGQRKIGLKIPALIILVLLVVGVAFTSTSQKYNQNARTQWPPGQAWSSMEELQLYLSLKELPVDARVYSYSGKGAYVLGLDRFACDWCRDDRDLRASLVQFSGEELGLRLKTIGYQYLIFDVSTVRTLMSLQNYTQEKALDVVNEKLQAIGSSSQFSLVREIPGGGFLFKVV